MKTRQDGSPGEFCDVRRLIKILENDIRCSSIDEIPFSLFDSTIVHQRLTRNFRNELVHLPFLLNNFLETTSDDSSLDKFLSRAKEKFRDEKQKTKQIDKFERNFSSRRVAQMFFKRSFVWSMFNESLSRQNVEQLDEFRFLIFNMKIEFESNRFERFQRSYRSFVVSLAQWSIFEKSLGQFISLDNFLSTYKSKSRALKRFGEPKKNFKFVLLKIDVDARKYPTNAFASAQIWLNYRRSEFVFLIGSIFQIVEIENRRNRCCSVVLRLCSNSPSQFKRVDEALAFSHALMTAGRYEYAQKYYKELELKFPQENSVKIQVLQNLALIHEEKNDLKTSLDLYHRALNISNQEKTDRAAIYNSLADVYRKLGQFSTAHEYFKRSLKILHRSKENLYDLFRMAVCYNQIGILYQEENQFQNALVFYQKAYRIRLEHFQNDQISLGISCNNIGGAFYHLKNYTEAFQFYQSALKIYQQHLPLDHPKIASIYNNIAGIYEQRKQFEQALNFYRKAALVYEAIYPRNSINLGKIECNIRRVTQHLDKKVKRTSLTSRVATEF